MIEVLVSTQNCRDPERLTRQMNVDLNRAAMCIVNQEQCASHCRTEVISSNLRILSFVERGLSRSRNRLLEAAEGDICVFADDDIVYLDTAWDTLEKAHQDRPDTTVISFKFRISGGHRQKRYRGRAFQHNWRTLHRVASIEISFKRARLPESVRFDERFGLGTPYPRGAECIYLNDLRRAGTAMRFHPSTICSHADLPTGRVNTAIPTCEDATILGVVSRRMYPRAWPLFVAKDCIARLSQSLPIWRAPGFAAKALASGRRLP